MADPKSTDTVVAVAELANEVGRAMRHQGYSPLAKTENHLAKMEAEEARGGKPQAQAAVPAGQGNLGYMSDKDRASVQAARAAMASAMTGDCREAEDRIACIRNAGGKKPTGQSKQ